MHVYMSRHRTWPLGATGIRWTCACGCSQPDFSIGPIPAHDRRILYYIERRLERGERRRVQMDVSFVARVVMKAAALYGWLETRVYCASLAHVDQTGTVVSY